MTVHGPHESKFRSFELYRRNIRRPEIITFDELLHRARFIVEDDTQYFELSPSAELSTFDPDLDEDVPF